MAVEAPLFVTAKDVSREQLNRLLVYLRDWEFGSGDRFSVITTRDRTTIIDAAVTQPAIDQFSSDGNAWSGATLDEVEEFANLVFPEKRPFLVLDKDGLRTQRCIVLAADIDPDTGEPRNNDFAKISVPWNEAYVVWANLNLANMDIEDFTDGNERRPGGWYEYVSQNGRAGSETPAWEVERNAFLNELERAGDL